VLTISNYVAAQNNKERQWQVKYIIQTMQERTSTGCEPIIAHRGYWKGQKLNGNLPASAIRWYPENSYASVLNCHLNGIEAAEIDIRSSKDGVPYLMHDLSLGRTTDQSWNPMTHKDTNNLVADLNFSQVPKYLRAWHFEESRKVIGNTHPQASTGLFGNLPQVTSFGHVLPTLDGLLKWYKQYDIRVVLFLEVQTAFDFENIYRVVEQNNAFNFCVFKLGIGGGPVEGYFPMLEKAGIFKKQVAFGRIEYQPIKRDANKPFYFTTIAYQDTKEETRKFIQQIHNERLNYRFYGIQHVYCELVAKTNVVAQMNYLYAIAEDCSKKGIRTGGYWVIPAARFKSRANPSVEITGYFVKSGANISSLGNATITQNGSCCGSAGSNEFQTNLDNVRQEFKPRYIVSNSDPGKVVPKYSGMGSTLITSDEVEYLLTLRKGNNAGNLANQYYSGGANKTNARVLGTLTAVIEDRNMLKLPFLELFTIFPNPVQNELKVSFNATSSQDATISLVNTDGKVLIQQKHKAASGNNTITVNTASIVNGTYIIRVQTANNIATKTVVVLK
jgi:hypothetical protein